MVRTRAQPEVSSARAVSQLNDNPTSATNKEMKRPLGPILRNMNAIRNTSDMEANYSPPDSRDQDAAYIFSPFQIRTHRSLLLNPRMDLIRGTHGVTELNSINAQAPMRLTHLDSPLAALMRSRTEAHHRAMIVGKHCVTQQPPRQ